MSVLLNVILSEMAESLEAGASHILEPHEVHVLLNYINSLEEESQ